MPRVFIVTLLTGLAAGALGCGDGSPSGEPTYTGSDVTPTWPAGPEDDWRGRPSAQATYTTCGGLWQCGVDQCQANPGPTCLKPCVTASSEALVTAFHDVTKCGVHVCAKSLCKDSDDPNCVAQCLWSRCLGFAAPCNVPVGVTGSETCGTAWDCVTPCNGDLSCVGGCYAAATTLGQRLFLRHWSCIALSSATAPLVDCYSSALRCNASGSLGKSRCFDILQCSAGCGDAVGSEEFACNASCFGQGTTPAQADFANVVDCYTRFAQGHAPGDCASTLATCVAPAGGLTCAEVDPCREACVVAGQSSEVCTFGCLKKATPAAARLYLDLTLCSSVTCVNQCRGKPAPDCEAACRAKTCSDAQKACDAP